MFFRRVFARKEHSAPAISRYDIDSNSSSTVDPLRSPKYSQKVNNDDKRGLSVLQLTPLWEHIIRTKSLPEGICEKKIFDEFVERLHDPEWQVRQHALRVLVDVLIVIGPRSDQYFQPLLFPLIENLGHAAPAVRKGALDALKVYMTETAMIEAAFLQIIDLGMERKSIQEKYGGRLCVGTMLSLPALVHTCLGTTKQAFALKTVIDALTKKMIVMPFQEVAIKVLLRIREMIGVREFSEYIAHGAYREFELLCNVYGLQTNQDSSEIESFMPPSSDSIRSWQAFAANARENHSKVKRTELNWRNDNEEIYCDNFLSSSLDNNNKYRKLPEISSKPYPTPCPKSATSQISCSETYSQSSFNQAITIGSARSDRRSDKVIMETEIQIQDTPVTMRIVEAENDNELSGSCTDDDNGDEDNGSVYEHSGVVRVLTDSELEEVNNTLIDTVPRTPKRVTFGGEEVKMRTPDSDSVLQSDNDDLNRMAQQLFEPPAKVNLVIEPTAKLEKSKTIRRPRTASLPTSANSITNDNQLKVARFKSASPVKRRSSFSQSGTENMSLSPRAIHKGIEVLHNLQRSPSISPNRSRRESPVKLAEKDASSILENSREITFGSRANGTAPTQHLQERNDTPVTSSTPVQSNEKKLLWENLGLVDSECLRNLRSGDWRLRCSAICAIEEMLKSTENLAIIQPRLESLFRTLLSSEKNPEVLEEKRRVIINLISRLPLDNLEDRTSQILIGLCRQGGSGSNRVAKALMQRLPPASVLRKLISDDFLRARSSRFRENALQMVLYSLMTFPSTHFDISTCVNRIAKAANDTKKRVRQAALDVLAVLGQISSPKMVLEEVTYALQHEADTLRLVAAIKARLSRKQLPTITTDGGVQYALRIPTPPTTNSNHYFGADIDWITSGVGSVSPTAIKRRSQNKHIFQNYSSSDSSSNRGNTLQPTESFRRSKTPHEMMLTAGGRSDNELHSSSGSSSYGGSGGNGSSTNRPGRPFAGNMLTRMTSYHSSNDDKNGHFVIATTIPSSDLPSLNGGLKHMQSSSFPDLSKRTAAKNGLVSFMDIGVNLNSKASRLPGASRFPSMESNMEARNGSRNEINNFSTIHTGNNITISKFNGSLPRNFNSTHIPIRNGYFSYSQGAPTYLSSNDDLRPSTHPIDNVLPAPKRFTNVNKYLEGKTNIDYSSDERTNVHHRYKSQTKGHNHQDEENGNETPVINIIKNSLQGLQDREFSRHNSTYNDNENNNRFVEVNSINGAVLEDKSVTTTPNRALDEKHMMENKNQFQRSANEQPDRPLSQISMATTKSLHDGDHIEEEASRPKTANTTSERSRSSSIHEILNSRGGSASSSGRGEEQEQQVVTDYDIDEEPSLENFIRKGKNNDNVEGADDGKPVEEIVHEQLGNHGSDADMVDGMAEFMDGDMIIDETTEDNDETEMNKIRSERMGETLEMVDVDDVARRNDYDSGSLTSTEESTDRISRCNDTLDKESSINGDDSAKPVRSMKRPPMLLRKNRVSDMRTVNMVTSASTAPVVHKSKSHDLFATTTMRRFDKPREAFNTCINQLDSANWESTMTGLQNFVRLIRFHPELVEANIHPLSVALCRHVKNLRSQVSRSACQACGEFFATHSKHLEQEIDDLATTLLNRTADTNKFLRADAAKALNAMCDQMPAHKTIQAIVTRGATHPNAIVRTASASLCNRIINRLGCDKIFAMNRDCRDKFILAGANFMMEGSLETRNYAKLLFKQMSGHPLYGKTILEVIPPRTYRNIEKSLKTIK